MFLKGSGRMKIAEAGISRIKDSIDTLVVLHNDQLLSIVSRNTTMAEAFQMADETLGQCILGISDLVASPGIVKVDMEDLQRALRSRGLAYIGVGVAEGEKRLTNASSQAIANPMLHTSFRDAKVVLVNITGPASLSIIDIREAAQQITGAANPQADITLGTAVDDGMSDSVRVIIIATGLE